MSNAVEVSPSDIVTIVTRTGLKLKGMVTEFKHGRIRMQCELALPPDCKTFPHRQFSDRNTSIQVADVASVERHGRQPIPVYYHQRQR